MNFYLFQVKSVKHVANCIHKNWFVLDQWCHPGLRFGMHHLNFLNKIVWFQIHTHLKFQKYQTDLKFYLVGGRRIKKIKIIISISTLPSHNTTTNTKSITNITKYAPQTQFQFEFFSIENQLCKDHGVQIPLRCILFEFKCFKILNAGKHPDQTFPKLWNFIRRYLLVRDISIERGM